MRKRVTFEADDVKLFDTLRAAGSNTDGLGGRMVSALLSDPSTAELIGMAVFGVTYIGHDDETERYRIALEQIKALRDGYQGGNAGRKAGYRVAGGMAEQALSGGAPAPLVIMEAQWPEATNAGTTPSCQLRARGKPCPRTCPECGMGPCPFGRTKP